MHWEQRMREVETRAFRVGHCRHPQAMTIRGGGWAPAVFPALAVLIRHPEEGAVLFDTGYDPAFFAATDLFPERLYRWLTPPSLRDGEDIASQLTAADIAPADVRHLILSHFHADHMAGAHHFPGATIHCARAGFDAICRGGRFATVRRGMLRALIPPNFDRRARFFEDDAVVALPRDLLPFTEGADLFGDGSVIAVALPGHCAGHWGVLLREDRGLHFLVADAAWSSEAIRRNAPPPAITAALLGDAAAGRKTLADLHRLRERNPDIALTPSHCLERAEALAPRP